MKPKVGGVVGNVHIVLCDKYGSIKQDITRKNSVTVSFIWQMFGLKMWNGVNTSYGNINFASNTAIPTKNFSVDNSQSTSVMWGLYSSTFYSVYSNPTPSINPNPAEGNPYVSASYYIAPGVGSGTIKTIYVSTNTYGGGFAGPSSIASYIVLNTNEWVIKGVADALTVTWIWYFAGNFKNNWF